MSIYYHQEFVSSEPLFAEVQEELSSYFASGAIDTVMFPKWMDDCLKRFRKSAYKIEEVVLHIKDYKACLPTTFKGVREAWACETWNSDLYQSATSQYYQQDCRIDTHGSPNPFPDNFEPDSSCQPCQGAECTTNYNVVHKVSGIYFFSFRRTFLLTPGNERTRQSCGEHCPNIGASTPYTFDIDTGNFIVNFREGTVHLIYYSDPARDGDQMIPDNWWFQDFARKYIIYKCFTKLANIITDETFNQIVHKKAEAKQDSDVAFIIAETEMKKQNIDQKMRAIRRSYEQNDKYRIPGDMSYNKHRRI